MPEHDRFYSRGSRVITLSAIPESARCPISAPRSALIEVIQMSGPVEVDGCANAIHVMFIYETETDLIEHHAIVSFNWFMSQFPLRLLASIPESIDGLDSTRALSEGPIESNMKDDEAE